MAEFNLQYDGKLDIATGLAFDSRVWKNKSILWSKLVQKLSEPIVTGETYKQFMAASKAEQGRIKDVGGFVGGSLLNGKRKKESVKYRQLLTLDIDFSHNNFWWDFTMLYDCAAFIHSTHKSSPEKPRHRLIIPLSREVSAEEYEPIARRVAGDMNIELFDQSTYEVNRLMFWPSISCDAEFYYEIQDGPFLDADEVLATYSDWKNVEEWPHSASQTEAIKAAIEKQGDPTEKKGIIGAFCRTHTIQDVIETFLSDVYEEAGENRYTYTKGSTAAGAIVYDDMFLYSHHGTDPAGGRLCNAFDLVRIHKFGHLDTGKEKEDKQKPSFKAMEEFVTSDKATRREIANEKFAEAKYDFGQPIEEDYDNSWAEELTVNSKGEYDNSAPNINLILQNDQILKDCYSLNTFDFRRYVLRNTPWRKIENLKAPEPMRDVDYSGIRNYIECVYGINSSMKIDDAFAIDVERRGFHPIQQYILNSQWDRVNRVDTLLIDYFGCDDNAYTRAAIRKSLCAAVARVFEPGTKFDMVLILVGEQGTYKSTFLRKLGVNWFSDTFTTVQGKEAYEQLQGAWIIEMAELSALKKSEVENIKQFISKCDDAFRPAYGRTVEIYKRQCVFFGTTNDTDFLKDSTGNRRFNPIDIHPEHAIKSVKDDLNEEEVRQIWAEAYELWKHGEQLYFDDNEGALARAEQHKHTATDERRGVIESFLERMLPDDWDKKDLYDRRTWLDDPLSNNGTWKRDFICMAEIWCECLQKDKTDMSRYNTREINDIMRSLPDWEFVPSTKNFPIYGKQKYYKRKDSLM